MLSAPFWRTWLYSEFRLLWFWAFVAAVALTVWRAPGQGRLLAVASAWAGFTMLPYSFLTYMPFVPSRHTYLASAGVAFIVAAAFVRLRSVSWYTTLDRCGFGGAHHRPTMQLLMDQEAGAVHPKGRCRGTIGGAGQKSEGPALHPVLPRWPASCSIGGSASGGDAGDSGARGAIAIQPARPPGLRLLEGAGQCDFRRAFQASSISGTSERKMTRKMAFSKCRRTSGTLPRKYPSTVSEATQATAPNTS